jgi:rubrerythrin
MLYSYALEELIVARFNFDDLIDYLKKIFADKKRRNIIILFVLIFVLIFVLAKLTKQDKNFYRERYIICPECHYTGLANFEDIEDIRCPKCNSKVSYDWKCYDCDFEFPLFRREIPPGKMSKKELIHYRIRESKCPKCSSINTYPKNFKK